MRFLTLSEVARALNVSASTIRAWEKRGSLIPTQRGLSGARLYDVELIAEWVKRGPPTKLGRDIR
jgi:DNA-binding transcriptional MerR regulator